MKILRNILEASVCKHKKVKKALKYFVLSEKCTTFAHAKRESPVRHAPSESSRA